MLLLRKRHRAADMRCMIPPLQALKPTYHSTFGLLTMLMLSKLSNSVRVADVVRALVPGCCSRRNLANRLAEEGKKWANEKGVILDPRY